MQSNVTFYAIYLTGKLRCHRSPKETATCLCSLAPGYIFQTMVVLLSRVRSTRIIELENKYRGIENPKLIISKSLWGKIMTMCQTEGVCLNFFCLLGILISPSFWTVSKDQAPCEVFRYLGTGSLCCMEERFKSLRWMLLWVENTNLTN